MTDTNATREAVVLADVIERIKQRVQIFREQDAYSKQVGHAAQLGFLVEQHADAILALLATDRAAGVGEETQDALTLYRALGEVEPVYVVEGIRVSTDLPFSYYVVGPEGEVAYCQTEDGEQHAAMIAAALNDRVAMCRVPANDTAASPSSPADASGEVERLREALRASLSKRSVPTMDAHWSAAFNAALDMVAHDMAADLNPTAGAK